MTRTVLIALVAFVLADLGLGRPANAADRRPNVLLIITDQQRADMLSCAGNPYVKTPALDRLAASGVRFERAYCANPVCLPSRFSMMTGVLPSRIGMEKNNDGGVRDATPEILRHALGNVFRDAGYKTVYGGKIHLPAANVQMHSYGFRRSTRDEREELARDCVDFLRQKHSRPFLLVASFINPHDICYMAIDAWRGRRANRSEMPAQHPRAAMPGRGPAAAGRYVAGGVLPQRFVRRCPKTPHSARRARRPCGRATGGPSANTCRTTGRRRTGGCTAGPTPG